MSEDLSELEKSILEFVVKHHPEWTFDWLRRKNVRALRKLADRGMIELWETDKGLLHAKATDWGKRTLEL